MLTIGQSAHFSLQWVLRAWRNLDGCLTDCLVPTPLSEVKLAASLPSSTAMLRFCVVPFVLHQAFINSRKERGGFNQTSSSFIYLGRASYGPVYIELKSKCKSVFIVYYSQLQFVRRFSYAHDFTRSVASPIRIILWSP